MLCWKYGETSSGTWTNFSPAINWGKWINLPRGLREKIVSATREKNNVCSPACSTKVSKSSIYWRRPITLLNPTDITLSALSLLFNDILRTILHDFGDNFTSPLIKIVRWLIVFVNKLMWRMLRDILRYLDATIALSRESYSTEKMESS